MSANLAEFLKVFTIVVTWASCILCFRRWMVSFDEQEKAKDEEEE